MSELTEEYEFVRKTFFPRWDRKEAWKAKKGSHTGYPEEHGYCDAESRTIFINPRHVEKGGGQLRLMLVHEICHAVAGAGHGKRWRSRMEKAAEVAASEGMSELADLIREDAKLYAEEERERREWNRTRVDEVYGHIGDVLLEHRDASYKEVVQAVARRMGYQPDELERQYTRLQEVYEESQELMADIFIESTDAFSPEGNSAGKGPSTASYRL